MGLSGAFAAALLEEVGVGVHLQDVDVVSDAVEEGAGEPLGAEYLGPLIEGQIAVDERSLQISRGIKTQRTSRE